MAEASVSSPTARSAPGSALPWVGGTASAAGEWLTNIHGLARHGLAAMLALGLVFFCAAAQAQNNQNKTPATQSAFGPKKPLIATPPPIDQTKPLLLNADELLYDNARNRVTARGNVEMYYNNYTVLADQG